jgi:hypothetical protein
LPAKIRVRFAPGDEESIHLVDLREVSRIIGFAAGDGVEGLARRRLHQVRAAVYDGFGSRFTRRRHRPFELETFLLQKAAGHGQDQRRIKSRKQRELYFYLAHLLSSLSVTCVS